METLNFIVDLLLVIMLSYDLFKMSKSDYDYQSLHNKVMISLVFLIVLLGCFKDAATYILN